ncbi:MAG: carboxypeptidase-like regulatory domain-containing protein [Bacteroides sp.]|nr:carboxypeptidase-like regulatory domain-containing protein [Bacteroides sp.]
MKPRPFFPTVLLLLGACCMYPTETLAQESENLIVISGVVKDARNKRTLEYVNVTAAGSNVGTITNSDGAFTLKIRPDIQSQSIEFSHLGYQSRTVTIPARGKQDQVFLLTPNSVVLKEVVVSPVDPRKLVEQAMQKKVTNYNDCSAMHTGFYRETAQKRRKYISISEAIVDVYKTPYTEDISKDRVRVFKGRRLLSPRLSDTLAIKLVGGPTQALVMDMVKNPDVLLSHEYMPFYEYILADYVTIDDRLHYAIRFAPRARLEDPLYEGTLYIDTESVAITRCEFNLDMRDKKKVTQMILRSKPPGLVFKPSHLSYLVTYRQAEGKTYLNYMRTEIKFRCDWKKKLLSTSYTVLSEVVLTDREDNPLATIPARESFRMHHVLSDRVMDFYDENFWEDYNIIEPTESLESAVKRLKKVNL